MSIAPHSGVVDFGTFTPSDILTDGVPGEVPAPLLTQIGYILSTNGWVPTGTGPISGTSQLDFGSGNKTAEVVVSSVSTVLNSSRVMATMRIEATANHPIDDLQIDPIRVGVKNLIAGIGFTIYGEMDNAPANGLYEVDWLLSN